MPEQKEKDSLWFKMDSNAPDDPKIEQMRLDYGIEGFGLYIALICKMREQSNYKLFIGSERVIRSMAKHWDVQPELLTKFISDCIDEFQEQGKGSLFSTDEQRQWIWSPSLIRRMAEKEHASAVARQKAEKRWGKYVPEQKPEEQKPPGKPVDPEPVEVKVSEQAVSLSNKLKALILKNHPKAKVPKDLNSWAQEIDRMISIDKREPGEILKVMEFSQKDKFWHANILSAGSLREKYDTLFLKMNQIQNQNPSMIPIKTVVNNSGMRVIK